MRKPLLCLAILALTACQTQSSADTSPAAVSPKKQALITPHTKTHAKTTPAQPTASKHNPTQKTQAPQTATACKALKNGQSIAKLEKVHRTSAAKAKVSMLAGAAKTAALKKGAQAIPSVYMTHKYHALVFDWVEDAQVMMFFPCDDAEGEEMSSKFVYIYSTKTNKAKHINPDVNWPRSGETYGFSRFGNTTLLEQEGEYSGGTNSVSVGLKLWTMTNQSPGAIFSRHLDVVDEYNADYSKYAPLKKHEQALTRQPGGFVMLEYLVTKNLKSKNKLRAKRIEETCTWKTSKKAFVCKKTQKTVLLPNG